MTGFSWWADVRYRRPGGPEARRRGGTSETTQWRGEFEAWAPGLTGLRASRTTEKAVDNSKGGPYATEEPVERPHGRRLFPPARARGHEHPLAARLRHGERRARPARRSARLHLRPLRAPDAGGEGLRAARSRRPRIPLFPRRRGGARRRQRARADPRRHLPRLRRAHVRAARVGPGAQPRGVGEDAPAARRAAEGGDMSAGGLVYALVAGGLIALAAHAIEGIARARRWPTRWILAASMAGTIAVIVSAVVPPSGAVPDEIMARGATIGTATAASTTSTLALMLRDLRTMA